MSTCFFQNMDSLMNKTHIQTPLLASLQVFIETIGSIYRILHTSMPNSLNKSSTESYLVTRPCLTSSIASLNLAVLVTSNFSFLLTGAMFHPMALTMPLNRLLSTFGIEIVNVSCLNAASMFFVCFRFTPFAAAKLQQKLHICKRSGVFSSNKMKFYGLNGHMGRLCSHKNDL